MSDRNTADNWRLEESDDTSGRWKLEETEQNQLSQWELQEDDYYTEEAGWQPVQYAREPQRQGGGWVLPSLVGLALIAVVAYGGWIGMTRLGAGTLGEFFSGNFLMTPVPTAAPIAAADTTATAPAEAAPTTAPTATPEPTVEPTAIPTVAPTPALVEQQFATISAQYGINARPNPSTDNEAIRILEQNEEFLIVDSTDGWYQVVLPPRQLAWIASDPEFVTVRSEQVDLAIANQRREQAGLPLLGDGTITTAPEISQSTTAVTVTNGITTAPAPDIQPITGGLTTATITGTVNITAGLNARSEPSTNGVLVALLENNTQLALDGRTADNSWYRSQLSNSVPIWVFADFIVVDGDPTVLPVIDVPGISASETNTVTETATTLLSTSTTVTESAESPAGTLAPTATPAAPAEAPSDTPALASVNTILGAAIRAAPEAGADAIATAVYENVLTVTGRSADNAWLQVDLGNSEVGWVLVSAVELSVDLATLPVAP